VATLSSYSGILVRQRTYHPLGLDLGLGLERIRVRIRVRVRVRVRFGLGPPPEHMSIIGGAYALDPVYYIIGKAILK
jgi:hypothetical protein